MKQLPLYIVLAFFCACCKNITPSGTDVLSQFSDRVGLDCRDTVIAPLVNPMGVVFAADSLLVVSEPEGSPMILIYDLSGRRIQGFLRRGRGPGETPNHLRTALCSPNSIQASVDPETVYIYDIDSLLEGDVLPRDEFTLPSGTYAFPSISVLDSIHLLYVGKDRSKEPAVEHRFCIYNTSTGVTETFGSYPEDDRLIKKFPTDDFCKPTAYQGTVVISPDHSKAVVIYYYAVGFDILDIEERRLDKSVFYQYPQTEVEQIPEIETHVVRRNPDSLRGFLDCWCNDEHIYVLYSGKTFSQPGYGEGKYILRYGWDGSPQRLYELEHETSCFTVSADESSIYSVVQDSEDAYVVRYDIPVA